MSLPSIEIRILYISGPIQKVCQARVRFIIPRQARSLSSTLGNSTVLFGGQSVSGLPKTLSRLTYNERWPRYLTAQNVGDRGSLKTLVLVHPTNRQSPEPLIHCINASDSARCWGCCIRPKTGYSTVDHLYVSVVRQLSASITSILPRKDRQLRKSYGPTSIPRPTWQISWPTYPRLLMKRSRGT